MRKRIAGSFPFRRSLARRLLAAMLLLGVLLTLGGTAGQLYLEYRHEVLALRERIAQIRETHSESLAASLWTLDREMLDLQLRGILQTPGIDYLAIRKDGKEEISAGIFPRGPVLEEKIPFTHRHRGRELALGTLHIVASLETLQRWLWAKGGVLLASEALKVFLITAFLVFLFYWWIGRHLSRIADHAGKLDVAHLDSDFALRRPRRGDELDQVVDALNHMSHNLQAAFQAQRAINATLQEKVAELERSEARVRDLSRHNDLILNAAGDGILGLDTDGRITFANPAAALMTGWSMAELVGQPLEQILHRSRPDALSGAQPECPICATCQDGEARHIEDDTFWRRDGACFPVEYVSTPILQGAEIRGAVIVFRDLSERQAARNALIAKEAAEAANRTKSEFLANMSHELRTPLNAVLGFSNLLQRAANLTPEQRDDLRIVIHSGEHLLALINDVLDMSKIEAGQMEMLPESFDLHELLHSVVDMFRLRARDKGLFLSLEYPPELARHVKTDPGKLRQVLINLVSNAVKYTAQGGAILRAWDSLGGAPAEPSAGCRVYFEVADSGTGIAAGELGAVFDAFVQVGRAKRGGEGTGLGLAISRRYVSLLGGELEVSSEPGKGSVFGFSIPVEQVEPGLYLPNLADRRVIGLQPAQPDYRILVAEDKPENRLLLSRLLRLVGFGVREAMHGAEAVELCRSWRPHLVWMDMRMPVMDGYAATRQIKNTPQGQECKIIALTASAFAEDQERILAAGCDDMLRKPFREEDIFKKMEKHLGVRFVYAEPAQETPAAPGPAGPKQLRAELAALPENLRKRLQIACLEGNMAHINRLLADVRQIDARLAGALESLADEFEYAEILALLEDAREYHA